MGKPATWGLIGFGNIGHEVLRQISQSAVAKRIGLEQKPLYIFERVGVLGPDGRTLTKYKDLSELPELADVNFIALPSSNDGKLALSYILPLLEKGKLVITAEKGALANHFSGLKAASDGFKRFGITATVGGGTRLLYVAREYSQDIDNITQIHLALNGTLAAMMDWVSPVAKKDGFSLDEAAKQAVAHGYAEPGSTSPAAIIKAEAEGDIPKKLAIFYNIVGLGPSLVDWSALQFSLTDEQITQAASKTSPRRFIASLYSPAYVADNPAAPKDDIIGGFNIEHDGWRLVGGFRRADADPLFAPLANLSGPGNGIVVGLGPDASDGVYAVTGPGAGVNPTVNAMIDDFIRLKVKQAS
jgi:homoserine dehydrogenase